MSLPIGDMEEEKPEEGSRAASLAALMKGFLPKVSLEDFPVEPEKACQKLPVFLPVWLKEKVTKPEARTALRLAAPKIGTESREQILNNLRSYRKFLLRKKQNMKTGEKTEPHVLYVLKQMEPGKACVSKPAMAVSGQKPAKRLRVKTPEKEAIQKPEMAEQASSSKPKVLIAVSADEESAASDGNSGNDGSAASDGNSGNSDVDFLEISSTSEEEITAEKLKKPEMAQKKPAKSSKQAKAKASMKKPSVVMAHHHSWVASCSFGLVKETKASSKAYIQARDGPTDKPYCLVNVSLAKGAEQSQVMAELMEAACKPGWTKDKLVDFKNSLLKRLG